MSEILRDPMWQFVGALVAVVSVLVAVILFVKAHARKSLSYEIVSLSPLLSVGEEIKNGLQILYRGKEVAQVHLVMLKIINSGNVPIVSADYERPISLNFGASAQILWADIAEKNPESLRPSVNIAGATVVLTPLLLNQGDWVTLKVLAAGLQGEPEIDGRMTGVKHIKKTVEIVFPSRLAVFSVAVQYTGLVGAILLRDPALQAFFEGLWILGSLLGATTLLLWAYLHRKKRRRKRKKEA